jgi:GT2 family glycosyltransferase
MAGYDDYRMIVVDQASTDGTSNWLKSLEIEGYYKLKAIYNKVNTGDAGGMKDGFKVSDAEYVMQWDNDCRPLTPHFLQRLVKTMDENPEIGILMLKRKKVKTALNGVKVKLSGERLLKRNRATCCMMIRSSVLRRTKDWRTDFGWVFDISRKILELGYHIYKTEDILVEHIDGHDSKGGLQHKKYGKLMNSRIKKTNFKNFKYGNTLK